MFAALLDGSKTFEYRRNDRDYSVGDVLVLREWDPALDTSGMSEFDRKYIPFTKRKVRARVTYIAHGGQFEIPIGFCVMAIAPEPAAAGETKGGGG